MRPRFWITPLLVAATLQGCAHDPSAPPGPPAFGTSALAPFDDVNIPHPNSREQLSAALKQRGFLAANAGPETHMGGAIRAFQRSEGIRESGFPDDETLRRLGIDPATRDRTLDPSEVQQGMGSSAGVSH
jgi:hypothetical protein